MQKTVSSVKSKTQPNSQLFDVYIRNNKKQALLIHTPQLTNLKQITRVIADRFRVPSQDQILFHNGLQLTVDGINNQIEVQDKEVLHLVDKRNVQKEIVINVRRLAFAKVEQFQISSSQIIEDFIVRNILDDEPEKIFMVYTGRQLRRDRSFMEEFVENESQLFCLHEDHDEVRGERRSYYESRIKEEGERKEVQQKQDQQESKDEQAEVEVEGEEQKQEMEREEPVDASAKIDKYDENSLFNYLPRQGQQNTEQELTNQEKSETEVEESKEAGSLEEESEMQLESKREFKEEEQSVKSNEKEEEQAKLDEEEEEAKQEESIPNFKKKNQLQEVNLARNQQLRRSNADGNLSELNQNNFVQSPSGLNSQLFNDASSISEIVSCDAYNPQSSKKLEEGSMFQSAYMGLNNQQMPSRIIESSQIREERQQASREDSSTSLNFYSPAPEMIPQTDRHLTVLEREILEVTEESIENSIETQVKEQSQQEQPSPESKKDGDASHEHNQFQLGDIENHMLSASTELQVSDPMSPGKNSSKQKQNNEILIEDQSNIEEEAKPLSEKVDAEDHNIEYIGVELVPINQHSEESELQSKKVIQDNQGEIEEKEIPIQIPKNDAVKPQQVDVCFMQQRQASVEASSLQVPQVVEVKQECETNHPSNSSNFYSKNSSKIAPIVQSSQEQISLYTRQVEHPEIMSQNIEQTTENEQVIHHESSEVRVKEQQEEKGSHHQNHDSELQIVDFPLQIKSEEHSSMLLDFSSRILSPNNNEYEGGMTSRPQEGLNQQQSSLKEEANPLVSKINELNSLISDTPDYKETSPSKNQNQIDDYMMSPAKESYRELKSFSRHTKQQSNIEKNTSLSNYNEDNENEAMPEIHPNSNSLQPSQSSFQPITIKKTLASQSSGTYQIKPLESSVKLTLQKESYAAGDYIFKMYLSHFDPLDFYMGLLQQQPTSYHQE